MAGWLKFQTRGESATCASIQFITDRPTLCSDEEHKYGGGRSLTLIAVDRVVALSKRHRDCAAPLTQVTFPSFSSDSGAIRTRSNLATACFQIQPMIHLCSASDNNQARSPVPVASSAARVCVKGITFSILSFRTFPSVCGAAFATNPPKISQTQ